MSVNALSIQEKDLTKVCATVNQLGQGRSNATGTVTLSTGATSTTVSAQTCGASSAIFLFPQTSIAQSSAAAYVASTDVTPKQFIIHHSSSTSTGRIFWWLAIG